MSIVNNNISGIFFINSVLPLGRFRKDKSFTVCSEKLSNPIEQIVKTRLVILNSGKDCHLK